MNNLICTRADDGIKEICNIAHPNLKWYAKKCGADFKILSDSKDLHPHWRILFIKELFEQYDRITVIDSDVLILSNTPSIFEEVEESHIGSIYEDVGSRMQDRQRRIQKANKRYGNVGWHEGYINTGVCIFSKQHSKLFEYEKQDLYEDLGYDDVYLGHKIHKFNYQIHELSYKWNHMSMFSEAGGPSRFDSYIIHYAGNGHIPCLDRTEQIKQDYWLLRNHGLLEVD